MVELLARATYLFALVLAPRLPSPDPTELDAALALLGVVLLALPVALSWWFVRSYGALEAKAALALWVLADLAILYEAHATNARGAPLLAGYYFAAPIVWIALATLSATLAGQYLGVSFKNKRAGAAVVTLAAGLFILRDAGSYVGSPKEQWREALRREATHERALQALADELVSSAEGAAVLARCVERQPDSCSCRALRAERQLLSEDAPSDDMDGRRNLVLVETQAASCESHPLRERAEKAEALALALLRRVDEADALARPWFERHPNDPRLLYTFALIEAARAKPDALVLARKAAERGAGRGAELLVTQLLISSNALDEAQVALDAYVKAYPKDADGLYNRALVADRRNDYNKAREGYLSALRQRPTMADARHNLVMLTLKYGATEEARHHARKFADMSPADPRKLDVLARVGLPP